MAYVFYTLIGAGIGVISGMLGIGGGVLLVPMLLWLAPGFDQRQAAGVALAVLAVPVVLPAVVQHFIRGSLSINHIIIAAWIAAGFACGGWFGAYVQAFIPVARLRLLFALILIYVAMQLILRTDNYAYSAFAGLVALAVAWLSYLGLRAIGRKHFATPPRLGDKVRQVHQIDPNEPDYYI
jgi:uncharacterized membrane protein YfcA